MQERNMFIQTILALWLSSLIKCIDVPPTWSPAPQIQTAQANYIKSPKTQSIQIYPVVKTTFANPFPSTPKIGLSIVRYQSGPTLSNNGIDFSIFISGAASRTSFDMDIQINTVVNYLRYRYIGIAPNIISHMDVVQNVGELVTYVTITSTDTIKSKGNPSFNFVTPYTDYKFVFFITCFGYYGTDEPAGKKYPPKTTVRAVPTSSSQFTMTVKVSQKATYTRFHYTVIVWNDVRLANTKIYRDFQGVLLFNSAALNQKQFPLDYNSYIMMGFTGISGTTNRQKIFFSLSFGTLSNGSYGLIMPVASKAVDIYVSYFYVQVASCPNSSYFLDKTAVPIMCIDCTIITNCIMCTSLLACDTCSIGYQPNGSLCTLIPCADINCLLCTTSVLGSCVSCNYTNNYYLSSGLCVLCNTVNMFINYTDSTYPCIYCVTLHCIQCATLTTCSVCDTANGYYLNPLDNQCYLCSVTVPNCLTCSAYGVCQTCDYLNGYYLDSNNTCTLCTGTNMSINITDPTYPCILCLPITSCGSCYNGYYLNTTDTMCYPCTDIDVNCIKCTFVTNSTCTVCDYNLNYYLNAGACALCTGTNMFVNTTDPNYPCVLCNLPNCQTCSSLTVCQTCNTGYVLNPLDNLCYLCQHTVSDCLTCTSFGVCQICNYTANYYSNTTNQCQLCTSQNMFINMSDPLYQCVLCLPLNCLNCTTISTCEQCDTDNNYVLNPSDLQCYLCSSTIANCDVCYNYTTCQVCNYTNNYYLPVFGGPCVLCTGTNMFVNFTDVNYPCVLCNIANCVTCSAINQCILCDPVWYYYVNPKDYQCYNTTICGDSLKSPLQQCQDGNTYNNDGCSSQCTVQYNFVCENNTDISLMTNICYYIGQFTVQLLYIQKIQNINQIQIHINVTPYLQYIWDNINFSNIITINNVNKTDNYTTGIVSYQVTKQTNGQLTIIVNYNNDIHNNIFSIQVTPNISGVVQLEKANNSIKYISIIPYDNQASYYYNDSVYTIADVVSKLSSAVLYAALAVFVIGIFCGRIIGIQMMAVIQLSYICLISLESLNPCFTALSNMWFVNGFNYYLLSKKVIALNHIPKQLISIHLHQRYWKNYNLNLILIVLPFVIGLVTYIISKTYYKNNKQQQNKLHNISLKCVCQFVFNGLMFSAYIVVISFAIQIKYGMKYGFKNIQGIMSIVQIMLLIIYILYFVLLIKFTKYFGEFNYYFKRDKNSINKKQYNIMLVQRFITGSVLIFTYTMKYSLVILIAIFAVLGFYVIIRKPYKYLRHNVRFILNILITMIILSVYTLYKFKTVQQQNKLQIAFYLPLIVCVLLIVCVVYSAVYMIYQIYLKFNQTQKQAASSQSLQYKYKDQVQQQMNNYIVSQIKKQVTNNNYNSPRTSLLKSERGREKQNEKGNGKHNNNPKQEQEQNKNNQKLSRQNSEEQPLFLESKNKVDKRIMQLKKVQQMGQYQQEQFSPQRKMSKQSKISQRQNTSPKNGDKAQEDNKNTMTLKQVRQQIQQQFGLKHKTSLKDVESVISNWGRVDSSSPQYINQYDGI